MSGRLASHLWRSTFHNSAFAFIVKAFVLPLHMETVLVKVESKFILSVKPHFLKRVSLNSSAIQTTQIMIIILLFTFIWFSCMSLFALCFISPVEVMWVMWVFLLIFTEIVFPSFSPSCFLAVFNKTHSPTKLCFWKQVLLLIHHCGNPFKC